MCVVTGFLTSLGLSSATAGAVTTGVTAAAAGTALSAAAGAFSNRKVAMPPSPAMPQATVDADIAKAEQDALKRQQIAGGLASTQGTPGGAAGAMLNPSTLGGKTLLGQ